MLEQGSSPIVISAEEHDQVPCRVLERASWSRQQRRPRCESGIHLLPDERRQRAGASVMTRTLPDLAEWLGRHDLGQYAQTFADNNIEYCVLADLTDDDLKNLGVSS